MKWIFFCIQTKGFLKCIVLCATTTAKIQNNSIPKKKKSSFMLPPCSQTLVQPLTSSSH